MVGTWTIAGIATLVGLIPGLLLFPWAASPFGPGIPLMNEAFARIFLTESQIIRDAGVLVKRKTGEYEIGTYLEDTNEIVLSDTHLSVDQDNLKWALFGKRPFGITWEPGTELHQRIQRSDTPTDGGDLPIDMAAAHRFLEGVNDSDAITRTENKAKAEHGGGSDGLSELTMALLVALMCVMGFMTTVFAL